MVFVSLTRILIGLFCSYCATTALAMSFTEALELARKRDPAFLSAQASYQAARERSNIAFSALLPQLNASGNTAKNDREYVTRGNPETTNNEKFNSNSAQINLTQGLWRHAERIASTQADLASQQSESQVAAAEYDLFVRFLQAWFDVMLARDDFHFTTKQTEAARKLRDQTTRAEELGVASKPELEEALARYEKALAEQAAAEAEEEVKFASLEQIVGPIQKFAPPSLSENQKLNGALGKSLNDWLVLAENANPSIVAGTYAVRAASEEIRKQRAGHEPTLDITGTYGRSAQSSGTTPSQQGYTNTQGTIGLQLNIPIFSGGGQSAKVREAIALRDKAVQDLENARRGVRSTCKQAWFGVQAGIARQKAATQAVKSATTSLRTATWGKERELKTDLDVLQATQQLNGALRDLQNTRYDILLNEIKLKAAAGQITVEDVVALNAAFVVRSGGNIDPATNRLPVPQQNSPVVFNRTHTH